MKKKYRSLIIFLLGFLSINCDPFVRLDLNGQQEVAMDFGCAKLTLTMTSGVGEFHFHQKFEILKPIELHKDKLLIEYNGIPVKFEFYGRDGIDESIQYNIAENETVLIAFSPIDGIKNGDIITIRAQGYITCNGKEIDLDELRVLIDWT